MSQTTNIEWADHTGSPWIGCTKVSPGCANCYAKTMDDNRFSRMKGQDSHWGPGKARMKTKGFWKDALKWNDSASQAEIDHDDETNFGKDLGNYVRPRVFPSLCDWLDDDVPIEWFIEFIELIYLTPNLDWLLLTKRPQNFLSRFSKARLFGGCYLQWLAGWMNGIDGAIPPNVWLGVSVEDQARADERIPLLLQIPARVRWLSVEPLLEPVDLGFRLTRQFSQPNPVLHWVVVGGESGPGRRDCLPGAIHAVAQQCKWAGVPVFVKQDSAARPGQQGRIHPDFWALKQFPKIQTT